LPAFHDLFLSNKNNKITFFLIASFIASQKVVTTNTWLEPVRPGIFAIYEILKEEEGIDCLTQNSQIS